MHGLALSRSRNFLASPSCTQQCYVQPNERHARNPSYQSTKAKFTGSLFQLCYLHLDATEQFSQKTFSDGALFSVTSPECSHLSHCTFFNQWHWSVAGLVYLLTKKNTVSTTVLELLFNVIKHVWAGEEAPTGTQQRAENGFLNYPKAPLI